MFERSIFRGFGCVLRHALVVCMFFVFCGTSATYAAYTLTYKCGSESEVVSIPSHIESEVVSIQTVPSNIKLTNNTGNNNENPEICSKPGYNFLGWTCKGDGDSWTRFVNGDIEWKYTFNGDTTCYAMWDNPNPCAPGSVSNNSPEILGKVMGALANDPTNDWSPRITLQDLFNPDSHGYSWGQTYPIDAIFTDIEDMSWKVSFDGLCSSDIGIPFEAGNPDETSREGGAGYCWCRVTAVDKGDVYQVLNDYPWVFSSYYYSGNCDPKGCAAMCMNDAFGRAQGDGQLAKYFENFYTKTMCEYGVNYNCGTLPTSGTTVGGTAPSSQTGIEPTSNVSLRSSAPNCNASGYQLTGWTCYTDSDTNHQNQVVNNAYSLNNMPYENVTCYANWQPLPTYTMSYSCGSGTLNSPYNQGSNEYTLTTYSSNHVLLSGSICSPRNGYEFYKWLCLTPHENVLKNPGDTYTLDPLVDETNGLDGECMALYREIVSCGSGTKVSYVLGEEIAQSAIASDNTVWGQYNSITLGDLWYPSNSSHTTTASTTYTNNQSTSWTVTYNGLCSTTPLGIAGETGIPSTDPGNYCWCQVHSVTINGSTKTLNGYPWVFGQTINNCTSASCTDTCASWPAGGEVVGAFRWQNLYTKNICTYGLTYNCNNNIPEQSNYGGGNYENGKSVALWDDLGNGFVGNNAVNNRCSVPEGMTFNGWNCQNAVVIGNTLIMPADNVTCTAQWTSAAPTQYTIAYTCGAAGGTMSSNTDTFSVGDTNYSVKANANGCNSYIGYHFAGWLCTPNLETGSGNITYSNTYPTNSNVQKTISVLGLSGNATCTAQWGQNIVNLLWDDNGATTPYGSVAASSCQYDVGSIPLPSTPPAKTGYSFDGWKVTNWEACPLSVLNVNLNGQEFYSKSYSNTRCSSYANNVYTLNADCSDNLFSDLNIGDFKVLFSDGTWVYGQTKCSNVGGATFGQVGIPGDDTGRYCWCSVGGYNRVGAGQCNLTTLTWVYEISESDYSGCASLCANNCAASVRTIANFRSALYGQTQ